MFQVQVMCQSDVLQWNKNQAGKKKKKERGKQEKAEKQDQKMWGLSARYKMALMAVSMATKSEWLWR